MRASAVSKWTEAEELATLLPSAYTEYVESCRAIYEKTTFFPLTQHEIAKLVANGNSAERWDLVRTMSMDDLQTDRIRNCVFQGKVLLGEFTDYHTIDGVKFPSGCYNTTICDTVILDNALVKDTLLLHRVLVDTQAVIVGCGSIVCSSERIAFGNGVTLHVGVETGGRDLRVMADLPFDLAVAVGANRSNTSFLKSYDAFVDSYVERISCSFTLIGSGARIIGCSRVQDCFIGECALIEDSIVINSSVLSSQQEPSIIKTKSIVCNTIMQWNSVVETLSVVEGAFLCDCSHVERQGIVMGSFIGPNTSIAEGEATSSFIGPFVGFHHQALVIASFWPEGKGNIGYGANVGSNHTLKAPDQELFPGEGMFFGLGSNVKFPSNFVKAPYSVIATAVTTLPQSVAMPFALINTPSHVIPALSPAINEISPGWVLANSVFTVLRNEHKFKTRNKSKRTPVQASIFRPEIVQYMKDARSSLQAAEGKAQIKLANGEDIYTEKQITGLGKNYMREVSRREAIDAYTFYIRLYALDGLLQQLEKGLVRIDAVVGSLSRTSYELLTLVEEFTSDTSVCDLLQELVLKRKLVASKAEQGKARDDARGRKIISDYGHVHKKAGEEQVVLVAMREASDVQRRVARFLARI